MNYIKTIFMSLMVMIAVNAEASKAVSTMFLVTLQDGHETMVRLVGDENLHYYLTADGKIVLHENGIYRYATMLEEENIKAISLQTGVSQRARLAELDGVSVMSNEALTGNRLFPHTGTPKALVIMVAFPDCSFIFSKPDVDNLFNSKEYNTADKYCSFGSLAQYFDDCSGGQFRPQFDIAGPYTLDNGYAYYGRGNDNNYALVSDACSKAAADGVDFTQYDADGDGYVDLVYIYYAGFGENFGGSSDFIWPKSGTANFGKYGGKQVFRYAMTQELTGYPGYYESQGMEHAPLYGVGVMAHEFSHTLGLPDMYPTASWSDCIMYDNQSMERWDLMDDGENINNGYYPTPYTAWERELMGWTEKMDTLSTRCDVTLVPLQDGGAGVRIMSDNDKTGNEYWILENVPAGSNSGWYCGLPQQGMLVTHINYDTTTFSNFSSPNNEQGSPGITIVPADGGLLTSYRRLLNTTDPLYLTSKAYVQELKGDPFPLVSDTLNVTSLTDYKSYTGTVDKPITDITMAYDGSVSFKFMGGDLIRGDVNGDGIVTVADANAVVNFYLGLSVASFDREAADMNGDGEITIADANAIVNSYLGK